MPLCIAYIYRVSKSFKVKCYKGYYSWITPLDSCIQDIKKNKLPKVVTNRPGPATKEQRKHPEKMDLGHLQHRPPKQAEKKMVPGPPPTWATQASGEKKWDLGQKPSKQTNFRWPS